MVWIFFDICVNLFYGIFYTWDVSSISCILLVILTSVTPHLFPRVSISWFASICVFFIVSTSTFRSWIISFNSFTCLPLFFYISFSELLISSLKDSIIFMRKDFRTDSWFSGMLVYLAFVVVGQLVSDDAHKFWFLLLMVLYLLFTIWISLVLVGLGDCLESASFVPGLLQISQ